MKQELDILEYNGDGYAPVMHFEAWRVALLNYCDRFDPSCPIKMERHLLTDEVFVLLGGEATLYIGEEMVVYPMEKNKIYNVRAGVWHRITTSRDAKVLIVENDDTSVDNSEYWEKGN